jgi:hypothetical protein
MHHRKTLASMAAIPLVAGLALTAGPTYAKTSTSFAFGASGFGTRITGGQVPVGSGTTAYKGIGCTNQAGLNRTNAVAEATVPGLGVAHDVRTRVWTTKHHARVASHSTHSIANIVLADAGIGTLSIDSIKSTAVASHNRKGFHATTSTQVGGITFDPVVGPAQTFPAPTPDQPVTIPGLLTIYLGQNRTSHGAHSAYADAFALRVEVQATHTSIKVAHAHAVLHSGFTGGLFSGHSDATHVITGANGTVSSGAQPLTKMPCVGTYGKTHRQSLASVDLGGLLVVNDASSQVRGTQRAHRAHGVTRAEVGQITLGGQVVIDGIVARAAVTRHGGHVTKSASGTTLASVTVAGTQQVFPKTGVLEIPGVAKLERAVVSRTRDGIRVIGLRITLLDGSGAVINLAEAALRIRPLH